MDTLTVDNSVAVVTPSPLIRYQYRDHLGSATMETNESRQVINYEEYHPFGTSAYRTARSGTDLSLKRYRFTNKERDDETGLYYFGVRYYAAWLGRWTSSDPGGFVDELNMYVYVRNNPINGVDQRGYSTENLGGRGEEPSNRIPTLHGAPEGITLKGITLPNNPLDGSTVIIPTEQGTDVYGVYDTKSDTWNYSNFDVETTESGASTGEPETIWDYFGLPSVWEGMKEMTVWDWGATILELGAGFTPFGILYDLYGLYEAVESGDSKAIGLALLAFVPVGDALKVLKRIHEKGKAALKKAKDIVERELDLITEGVRRTQGNGSFELSPDGGTMQMKKVNPEDYSMDEDALTPLPSKKKKKKKRDPNEVTAGTFPEPNLLEEKIGLPAGSYHGGGDGGVKGTLKGRLGLNENHPYGKNPDFGYDDDGNVLLKVMKGRNAGKFFKTGYTLDDVKKML